MLGKQPFRPVQYAKRPRNVRERRGRRIPLHRTSKRWHGAMLGKQPVASVQYAKRPRKMLKRRWGERPSLVGDGQTEYEQVSARALEKDKTSDGVIKSTAGTAKWNSQVVARPPRRHVP